MPGRGRRSQKAGLPPGTPVHVGRYATEPVRVAVMDYGPEALGEHHDVAPAECARFVGPDTTSWIDVDGVHDVGLLGVLGEAFGLHPLLIEDVASTRQRPKADEYPGVLYFVLRMLKPGAPGEEEWDTEQVSFVLGQGFVLSFQERPGDVFDDVRQRIRAGRGHVREAGPDYLLYCLTDAVVDGYFGFCEQVEERTDAIEEALAGGDPEPEVAAQIHALKRRIVALRRAVWPLREAVGRLVRDESPLIAQPTRIYFRDVQDHASHVIDTLDSFRDILSGLLDTYLSTLSNRMNEVMKVLTVIATLFIPLTFIAGIYGMNFDHMPELHWRWAYPTLWIVMVAVAVVMLMWFRRRRWL